ncbi:hypothetical protein [Candidatus Chlorohelix sp.]|uniref:hypothetical protein n=1 Tax=Candidatus Chlorohelix sp. TaxID=3139201 RepID=UPI00303A904A
MNKGDFDHIEYGKDESAELKRDTAFARHLETDWRFEPIPENQARLRRKLMVGLAQTAAQTERKGWLRLPALRGWQLATVALLFSAIATAVVVLVSVAISSTNDNPSAVANNVSQTLPSINDSANNKVLSLQDANTQLGFKATQPTYLPAGYSPDKASLFQPSTRNLGIRPAFPAIAPTLQLKYKTNSSRLLEAYQSELIQNLPPEARERITNMMFNMAGRTNKYKEQVVQGVRGFLIEDNNWKIGFGGRANTDKSDDASTLPLNGFPLNFYRNAQPSGGFLEYHAPDTVKSARALVWRRAGVVLVLVSDDNLAVEELQKIAESFQ